eukprot:5018243-Heterocapsa_arctica.AAC.1
MAFAKRCPSGPADRTRSRRTRPRTPEGGRSPSPSPVATRRTIEAIRRRSQRKVGSPGPS